MVMAQVLLKAELKKWGKEADGMVHAYSGQKLLKSNKSKSFLRWPIMSSEHCIYEYKCNSKTACP